MAGFDPISIIPTVVSMAFSAIGNAQASSAAESRAEAENQARQSEAQAQMSQLQAARDIEQNRRRQLLKEQLASQRARFGASGVDPNQGGSAGALMLGLVKKAEDEDKADEDAFNLKANSIQTRLANQQRLNLLDSSSASAKAGLGIGKPLFSGGWGIASKLLA
jgi:hypothetical protein